MKKQPAKINYFFKDAYSEFWATVKNTFSQCGTRIESAWDGVKDSFGDLWENILDIVGFESIFVNCFKAIWHALVFGLYVGRLVLSAVLIPAICIVFSGVQIAAVIAIMAFVYVGYLVFAFADWLYCQFKKISTSCPNCQEKYSLPTYVCECGAKHTKLVPSRYGILTRECECGKKLKTTFFNGRQKMPGKWVCPMCGYELGGPLQVDIPIPVVGGPSSGKTCYISMAVSQIEKTAEKDYNLLFEYKENAALGDDYKENKAQMSQGRLPVKTNDMRLRYYQFYLTPKGEKVRNLVSICDVAGETYEHNAEIGRQIGFKHANAFLMLIDPLSVALYRKEVENSIDLRKYGASERAMDEIIDALIRTLENMKCIDSKSTIKTDMAVVFTKCDIPGLNEKIGVEAIARYKQKNNITSTYEAQNQVCEHFLMEYEEENLLNTLKAKFKSIQFFTCSALGHVENGESFNPEGVEEPALWLIDKVSASIDLKEKWGKKI